MTFFDSEKQWERQAYTGETGAHGKSLSTTAPNRPARVRARVGNGIRSAIGYGGIIWVVFWVNYVVFGLGLNNYGIHPLDPSSLWGIVTSPLLHANFEHLVSNTVPGMVFAFIVGMSGRRVFWEVTAIAVVCGGLGTWLFGGLGSNHIGASGLVYGWLGYLLVRGIFNRSIWQIIVGVALGFLYSGLVWGLLPGTEGISWQGHLFGAIGGIAAGMFITSDDPAHLKAKRRAKKAGY